MINFDLSFLDFNIVPFGGFIDTTDEHNSSGSLSCESEELCSQIEHNELLKEHLDVEIDDKIETDKKSEILVEIENLDLSFLEDFENIKDSKKKENNSGGGQQLNSKSKIVKVSHAVKSSLERLANGMTFQKIKGLKQFHTKKVILNLISHKYKDLIISKNDFKPKEIYFFVDTSGSVWYLANMILTLINSTIKSNQIKVFSGSESHPNKNEKTGEIFSSYKRKSFIDEELKILFDKEKPRDETVMVFWGDCQGSGIREKELSYLLAKYNPIWLNPSIDILENSNWDETHKIKKVMKTKMKINTISAFIKELKKI